MASKMIYTEEDYYNQVYYCKISLECNDDLRASRELDSMISHVYIYAFWLVTRPFEQMAVRVEGCLSDLLELTRTFHSFSRLP